VRSSLKNQKIDITKYVAEQEGLSTEELHLKKLLPLWWQNSREKEAGGMRLTDEGFARLTKYFTAHQVRFEQKYDNLNFTSQMILRLDNFITCPWYITNKGMWVFDDKMAIQLVLFSGNIERFTSAKAKSLDKDKK